MRKPCMKHYGAKLKRATIRGRMPRHTLLSLPYTSTSSTKYDTTSCRSTQQSHEKAPFDEPGLGSHCCCTAAPTHGTALECSIPLLLFNAVEQQKMCIHTNTTPNDATTKSVHTARRQRDTLRTTQHMLRRPNSIKLLQTAATCSPVGSKNNRHNKRITVAVYGE